MTASQNHTKGCNSHSSSHPDAAPDEDASCPLCVDLDGTLIKSDLLQESMLLAIRRKPLDVLRWPVWLLRGKASFKQKIAQKAVPAPAFLPYRKHVLEYVQEQSQCGRTIVLASGSEYKLVKAVADHLHMFDHVIGSDGKTNCTKHSKVNAIRQLLGDVPFEYIGNSTQDLPVWEAAHRASAVTSSQHLLRQLKKFKTPLTLFACDQNQLGALITSLRLKQWTKNLLLLVPIFVSNRFPSAVTHVNSAALLWDLSRLLVAFVVFGLCASSIYILNDLLDIDADRRHPQKRFRPIPAGQVRLPTAICISGILFLVGVVGAVTLMGKPDGYMH